MNNKLLNKGSACVVLYVWSINNSTKMPKGNHKNKKTKTENSTLSKTRNLNDSKISEKLTKSFSMTEKPNALTGTAVPLRRVLQKVAL
jgi:hypothetical protein